MVPRTWPPASTPWTITASAPAAWAARASATEPHWWIQVPPVRRFGVPQKVTTTSAAAAASNQSRRAKGSSRLTAIGRPVSSRAARQLALDRVGAVDRDRPQPAGLGDRRGELVAAQPAAHPGLDDRGLDAEALEDRHPAILRCARVSAFRIVVLASGSGTNLQAILDRLHGGDEVEVVGVGSDKPGARALERAPAAGVETAVFPAAEYENRAARDMAMGDWIEPRGADLVVLAGYMQLLSEPFVARFRHRVVNVHPALLPAFPGLDAIGQALDAGVETTGVTVHFVDEGVDTGPVILQREVAGAAGRERAELEEAIHAVEHELYPEAIRMIAQGRVRIDASDPRVVVVDE